METETWYYKIISKASSYRTYEEWKRARMKRLLSISDGSYRTYEEWKQNQTVIFDIDDKSSYRTYEEWKPQKMR